MKISTNNIAALLVLALFIFLPFSSWLVSLSGNPWLSLVRDILIALIFIASLTNIKKNFKLSLIISVLFILYALASYLWRHSSPEQWLRGFRFLIFPIIFYASISLINFSDKQKQSVLWVIFGGFVLLAAIAILEYLNIRVPLVGSNLDQGALENFQSLNGKARLQSLLAGPNAFGLYLVGVTAFLLSAFRKISKYFIYLLPIGILLTFLTYSRSALIGIIILLLFALYFFLAEKKNYIIASIVIAALALAALAAGYKLYNAPQYQSYITHGTSTSLRTEQIQRIWQSRYEIGLLGRSLGTAGPSSQNRLDGGPNHWSENIYLDVFEETGFVGLVLFLALLIAILFEISYNFSKPIEKSAIYCLVAFLVTGMFINIYTGQIGIFLFWLLNGLSQKGKINEKNFN